MISAGPRSGDHGLLPKVLKGTPSMSACQMDGYRIQMSLHTFDTTDSTRSRPGNITSIQQDWLFTTMILVARLLDLNWRAKLIAPILSMVSMWDQ